MGLVVATAAAAAILTAAVAADLAHARRQKAALVPVRAKRVPRSALVVTAFAIALAVAAMPPLI